MQNLKFLTQLQILFIISDLSLAIFLFSVFERKNIFSIQAQVFFSLKMKEIIYEYKSKSGHTVEIHLILDTVSTR